MFARLIVLNLSPGERGAAEEVANKAQSLMDTMHGFKQVTFFMDDAAGKYGGFSLWETKSDAEAASEQLNNVVGELVGDKMKGEPIRGVFEVFESNG